MLFRISLILLLIPFFCASAFAEKIGIYTGTFDPPHHGHQRLVEQATDLYALDRVYVLPGIANHKKNALPHELRIKMVEVSIFKTPKAMLPPTSVWDIFMADNYPGAIKKLDELHADDEIFRIVGTDRLDSLDLEEIQASHTKFLVSSREENYSLPQYLNTFLDEKIFFLPNEKTQLSSTLVRNALKSGATKKEILSYISPNVYEILKSVNAYGMNDSACMRALK